MRERRPKKVTGRHDTLTQKLNMEPSNRFADPASRAIKGLSDYLEGHCPTSTSAVVEK